MVALSIQVTFSLHVFSLESVKRAAYKFTDSFYFDFSITNSDIICKIESKTAVAEDVFATTIQEFRNEVLDQDLRESISKETSDIRNVILSYVFSKTSLLVDD